MTPDYPGAKFAKVSKPVELIPTYKADQLEAGRLYRADHVRFRDAVVWMAVADERSHATDKQVLLVNLGSGLYTYPKSDFTYVEVIMTEPMQVHE